MPPKIQIISILICIFLVAYVFELVRRKHLSEEYSMGWLVTGTTMLALSVSEGLLKWVSELVGATLFTSTLFFFGLLFLMVICLHFFHPDFCIDQPSPKTNSEHRDSGP